MNIDEMSDQEKSVLLARLCGWKQYDDVTHNKKAWYEDYASVIWLDDPEAGVYELNLYDVDYMELAWRVLNWAMTHFPDGPTETEPATLIFEWWHDSQIYNSSPAEAQRLWLDKILSLAIEAGLVDDTAVSHEP